MILRVAALALAALVPTITAAQHNGGGATASTAPAEARQFDFLIGQWELVVRPKVTTLAARIHGAPKLLGTWKAWRAFDGFGVEDELRIVDGSGNPTSLGTSMRAWSTGERKWLISTLDAYRGRMTSGTAEWRGTEMVVSGRGTDAEGKPTILRTRFFGITPAAFRFQQDRSSDDGKTWEEGILRIDAKRVAASAPR
ncbi:MAG: hypothetical protein H7066_07845 [Cytophagaceae bacterium]|nr:hypothetical protein [Gemmatimonadaceae bacterium]